MDMVADTRNVTMRICTFKKPSWEKSVKMKELAKRFLSNNKTKDFKLKNGNKLYLLLR